MNVKKSLKSAGSKTAEKAVPTAKNAKSAKPFFYETEAKVILYGLTQLMRVYKTRFPEYKKEVEKYNFTAQMRTRDNKVSRWWRFANGKIKSGTNLIQPDCEMIFWHAEEMCRVMLAMLPNGNKLDFVHATKNMRAEISGDDKLLYQFLKISGTLLEQGVKYGTPQPDGTMRYTTNTNGGPLFVYVKDDKIIRTTPIEFDDEDAPSWTIVAHGRKFSPPRKTTVCSYSQCLKSNVYSKDRILIPHDP